MTICISLTNVAWFITLHLYKIINQLPHVEWVMGVKKKTKNIQTWNSQLKLLGMCKLFVPNQDLRCTDLNLKTIWPSRWVLPFKILTEQSFLRWSSNHERNNILPRLFPVICWPVYWRRNGHFAHKWISCQENDPQCEDPWTLLCAWTVLNGLKLPLTANFLIILGGFEVRIAIFFNRSLTGRLWKSVTNKKINDSSNNKYVNNMVIFFLMEGSTGQHVAGCGGNQWAWLIFSVLHVSTHEEQNNNWIKVKNISEIHLHLPVFSLSRLDKFYK